MMNKPFRPDLRTIVISGVVLGILAASLAIYMAQF